MKARRGEWSTGVDKTATPRAGAAAPMTGAAGDRWTRTRRVRTPSRCTSSCRTTWRRRRRHGWNFAARSDCDSPSRKQRLAVAHVPHGPPRRRRRHRPWTCAAGSPCPRRARVGIARASPAWRQQAAGGQAATAAATETPSHTRRSGAPTASHAPAGCPSATPTRPRRCWPG